MIRDSDGDTPLHACEDPACAVALLVAGADLEALNAEGWTPMAVAWEDLRKDMVTFYQNKYARMGRPLPKLPEVDPDAGDMGDDDEDDGTAGGGGDGGGAAGGAGGGGSSMDADADVGGSGGGGAGADAGADAGSGGATGGAGSADFR